MLVSLAYLALYPEEQDKLFTEIRSVLGETVTPQGLPEYDVMAKLPFALAVFMETLRLQPALVGIPKKAVEDTAIAVRDSSGGSRTYPVAANTFIKLSATGMPATTKLSATGMQRNPRLWSDPLKFDPSRFLPENVKHQRDEFLSFSAGARKCIGQRFAETEAVAILCSLLARYSVHLMHDEEVSGEGAEVRRVRREKILDSMLGITITPKEVPLIFKRRY